MREPGVVLWVLVADAGRARIFQTQSGAHPLREIADLDHAGGRLHNREIAEDGRGRSFDKAGPGRHAMAEPTTPHEANVDQWARDLADRLKQGLSDGAYQQLAIVAPPSFLGKLRAVLPDAVAHAVEHSLDKDLTQMKPEAVREHLPAFL